METDIETLVAGENWQGLAYYYPEAKEEIRMQYAYYFGTANLIVQPLTDLPIPQLTEKLAEAFRISLYDRRLAEDIKEFFAGVMYKLLINIEKQAREYTFRAGTNDPDAAKYSRIGFEHYLLMYFLHPSEEQIRACMSKEKVFLMESGTASFINDKNQYKCTWESLKQLLIALKPLDTHFIEGIVAFLRLFNTVDITRKNNQSGFAGYLLEQKELFSDDEVKQLTDFQSELQKECLLIFLEIMMGREDYKKRMLESKIQRAEEVKQFAFRYANCPENLDSSYFKETLVHKRASDLMAKSETTGAFEVIMQEYETGIPENSFLIRELLNEIVARLVENTGDMAYVVQALKIDSKNEKLKEYLLK